MKNEIFEAAFNCDNQMMQVGNFGSLPGDVQGLFSRGPGINEKCYHALMFVCCLGATIKPHFQNGILSYNP
jgi:hypothetical protein